MSEIPQFREEEEPAVEFPLQMILYFDKFPEIPLESLSGFLNDCDPTERDLCLVQLAGESDEEGQRIRRYHVRLGASMMVLLLFEGAFPESLQPELIHSEETIRELADHKAHALLHVDLDGSRPRQELQVFLLKVATSLCRMGARVAFNPWNGVILESDSLMEIAALDGSQLQRLHDAIENVSVDDVLGAGESLRNFLGLLGQPPPPAPEALPPMDEPIESPFADTDPDLSFLADEPKFDEPGDPDFLSPTEEEQDEFEKLMANDEEFSRKMREAAKFIESILEGRTEVTPAGEDPPLAGFAANENPEDPALTLWDLIRSHAMPTEMLMTLAGLEDEEGGCWLVSRGLSVYGLPDLLYRVSDEDTERDIALMKIFFEKVFRCMWRGVSLTAGDVFRSQTGMEFRLERPPSGFESPFPTLNLLLVSRWNSSV